MKIYSVTQVTVIKKSDSPTLQIHAMGMVASTGGWTNPRLDNSADSNPSDPVLEFSFEADYDPSALMLPVLTPISAAIEFVPKNEAAAVIVSGRTNSITVHASEFISGRPPITTMVFGEEGPPTTFRWGEEGPPTTFQRGEEGPPTTFRWGEEGPQPTTLRFGEEGPITDPRVDDPVSPTLARGEEDPGGGPFGSF